MLTPGALFSCGDCHSAQGDGEVNGTGIETPMTVTLRFQLHKNRPTKELRFITPAGRRLTVADLDGYYVATAHGPDLSSTAQNAIRYIIEHLVAEHDMTAEQAYCLCGAAVDLKIRRGIVGRAQLDRVGVPAAEHLSLVLRREGFYSFCALAYSPRPSPPQAGEGQGCTGVGYIITRLPRQQDALALQPDPQGVWAALVPPNAPMKG